MTYADEIDQLIDYVVNNMPKEPTISDPEVLDKIERTVRYFNKHYADLEKITADLARKMGIDPSCDLVLVSSRWAREKRLNFRNFPPWMVKTDLVGQSEFTVKRGVRNPEAK